MHSRWPWHTCSVLRGDGSLVKEQQEEAGGALRALLGGGPVTPVDIPASMRAGWAPFNGANGQVRLTLRSVH